MAVDYSPLGDRNAVAELHVGADMGVRPDLDVGAENRAVFDYRRRMDFSHFRTSLRSKMFAHKMHRRRRAEHD